MNKKKTEMGCDGVQTVEHREAAEEKDLVGKCADGVEVEIECVDLVLPWRQHERRRQCINVVYRDCRRKSERAVREAVVVNEGKSKEHKQKYAVRCGTWRRVGGITRILLLEQSRVSRLLPASNTSGSSVMSFSHTEHAFSTP